MRSGGCFIAYWRNTTYAPRRREKNGTTTATTSSIIRMKRIKNARPFPSGCRCACRWWEKAKCTESESLLDTNRCKRCLWARARPTTSDLTGAQKTVHFFPIQNRGFEERGRNRHFFGGLLFEFWVFFLSLSKLDMNGMNDVQFLCEDLERWIGCGLCVLRCL